MATGNPRLRLAPDSPTILASHAALSVGAKITAGPGPRLPGTAVLSVIDLAATSARAHSPAYTWDFVVTAASVAAGETSGISVGVYAGWGVTVRNIEYRVGTGAWLPMKARGGAFGAFDEPSEYGYIVHTFPEADLTARCRSV